MRWLLSSWCFIGLTAFAASDERTLTIVTSRGLPTLESVSVYHSKDGKKEHVAEIVNFDKAHPLPNDGPFEIWVKPKAGIAVKVADKLTIKPGTPHSLKLGDLLGTIEVFGDDFPRADAIVLTDTRDPGPGEKGHIAIQTAKDYRVEMCVPPGMYAVWVIPANGAKPQRVEENVRVQAGRSVRVGD
jgi:hypothetical protein